MDAKQELTDLLDQFCTALDTIENRLGTFDSAIGFFKVNSSPDEASRLDLAIHRAETLPEVRNAVSHEHAALVQHARGLVSRVLQVISNLPNTSDDDSKP